VTLPELIAKARQAYEFREPRVDERSEDYRAALVDHVECHDLSMAHELRLGREQAAWTADDIRAFKRRLQQIDAGPRSQFQPGLQVLKVLEDKGGYDASDEELLLLGRASLQHFVTRRCASPRVALPVMISALLSDGRILHLTVDSGDRLAALRLLAQRFPLYGFLLTFDGWIHQIVTPLSDPGEAPSATKRDALFVHIGSRTLRRILIQPYDYATTEGMEHVILTDAELKEHDPRADYQPGSVDPYADLFVTVPLSSRVQ
jgi:hypothetical protein